jgi:hypothetical protein
MNELYQDKLKIVASDELLIKSLRTLIDEVIETYKPDLAGNNILIGEKYRSYETAKSIIADSFMELESYKENIKKIKPFNKAR